MAAVVGLTIVKAFTYRGDANEEWSNQYWLTGPIPSDSIAWRALFDSVCATEKTLYEPPCRIVRGYGYDSDVENAPAVWSVDLTVAPNAPITGTFTGHEGLADAPGDAAVWVRWKTSRLNVKGKPIYLRKYFHAVKLDGLNNGDTVNNNQQAAYLAFGSTMMNGTLLGGRSIRSQTHAEALQSTGVAPFITTRTLKRRGKRPGS